MLAKVLGIILLVVGGLIGVGVVFALVGAVLKVAIPVLLIWAGYRLITRHRREPACQW